MLLIMTRPVNKTKSFWASVCHVTSNPRPWPHYSVVFLKQWLEHTNDMFPALFDQPNSQCCIFCCVSYQHLSQLSPSVSAAWF